jgi:hypothetical protein
MSQLQVLESRASTFQRGEQMGGEPIGLGDNLFDADGARIPHQLVATVHREQHHCRARGNKSNLPARLKAIHHEHLQIQYHDVGLQFLHFFNRYLAVLRFATYPPVLVPLNQGAEGTPNRRTIIDDQNGTGQNDPF